MNPAQPIFFFNIADLIDPNDPQGRTYRQVNHARVHAIPLGALVELRHDPEWPDPSDGVRLFVIRQSRDCDGTPLYDLCADPEDTVLKDSFIMNRGWIGGYNEGSLKVIRRPGTPARST